MRLFVLVCLYAVARVALAAQDGGNFFDQPSDPSADERPVTSAFECYDHTHDFDQTICLDPEVGLLNEQMQRQYSNRLAAVPLSQRSALMRAHQTWREDTRIRCNTDVPCARIALQKHLLFLHQAPIIYRHAITLKKGEQPLHIAVTGRESSAGYLLHSLLLLATDGYGKEKVAQRIDFYSLMRSNHFELLHPQPDPYLIDANFDGWLDLVFFTGIRGSDIHRIYFIYQPQENSFRTDGLLNAMENPIFIDEYQLVGSPWQAEGNYGIDYYAYKENKLIRDVRVVYTHSTNTNGASELVMSTFSNRTGRMLKLEDKIIQKDQVGDLPFLYRQQATGNDVSNAP